MISTLRSRRVTRLGHATRSLGTIGGIMVLSIAGPTGAATAAPTVVTADYPIDFTFVGPSTVEIEYGEYWHFAFADGNGVNLANQHGLILAEVVGAPAGYSSALELPGPYTMISAQSPGIVVPPWDADALDAGTYEFAIGADFMLASDHFVGRTTGGKLTINPAALDIELRALPDPSNDTLTVVSARFTGRFATGYDPTYPGGAKSPEGTWSIKILNSAQEVVEEVTIDRALDDATMATSFPWPDAQPGEDYSATATFTPTGSSARNFAVTTPAPFQFTGVESARATPTSPAGESAPLVVANRPDFSVPVWWVALIGIAFIAFIALAVTFAMRLGRAPKTADPSEPTNA